MTNPDSVDDLLISLAARGLRLANLFQLDPDGLRWRANVTDGSKVWEFGNARSAALALRAAMFVAATEPGCQYPAEPLVTGGIGEHRGRGTMAKAEDLGL